MSEQKVTVSFTLSPDLLQDIIDTCEGSAITYWAMRVGDQDDGAKRFTVIQEHESSVDGREPLKLVLDPVNIAQGIERVLNPTFNINGKTRGYLLSAVCENDASYVDDDVADAIVQAALFNDLVYG